MKSFLPERRPDLEIREAEGELLVLDRRHGRIHKFNHSAALIFSCCDGRHTVEQIINRLADTYGPPVEIANRDVNKAIGDFTELGLLRTITAGELT